MIGKAKVNPDNDASGREVSKQSQLKKRISSRSDGGIWGRGGLVR